MTGVQTCALPISLRGNVQTRLRKLDEDQYAAIILAAAGLIRLSLGGRIDRKSVV